MFHLLKFFAALATLAALLFLVLGPAPNPNHERKFFDPYITHASTNDDTRSCYYQVYSINHRGQSQVTLVRANGPSDAEMKVRGWGNVRTVTAVVFYGCFGSDE